MVLEALTDSIRVLQIMGVEYRRQRRRRKIIRRSERSRRSRELSASQHAEGSERSNDDWTQIQRWQEATRLDDFLLDRSRAYDSSALDSNELLEDESEASDASIPSMASTSGHSDLSSRSFSVVTAASQEPYRGETPPASTAAIVDLLHLRLRAIPKPEKPISTATDVDNSESAAENDDDDDNALCCVICSENLENGDVVSVLPCGHLFHSSCVVPWLAHRCTCPNCRYELATDCPHFENGREERMKGRGMNQQTDDEGEADDQDSPDQKEPQDAASGDTEDSITDEEGASASTASSSSPGVAANEQGTESTQTKKTRTVRAWCGSVVVRLTMEAEASSTTKSNNSDN